ncbi:LD-carboxypeptidase [Natronosporangium hydrolyticum]|uniref:LD-carboxypeptidase n=1 Tax=Natronosporangium hydrolyticum TaxID=2811111 RepID=A0A895YMA3_9ACTN|nr:LD-carboxypeptidase [Natronosporangium hydrolyticum]QSB16443.1 LD-carboxypeptidase [Natronosporangium hydrolyticum]
MDSIATVRGPVLRPGDTVAVVSPAGPAEPELVEVGLDLFRSWGLNPVLGAHALDRDGFLAGRDEDRAADLNAALRDPQVRAVVATRGGYGAQRIVDEIDLAAARRDPKPVVGFSDITALQLALWRGARLACVHGPGLAWRPSRTGDLSAESLRDALLTTRPVVVKQDPAAPTAPVTCGGSAAGTLLGGNLCLLTTSLGTPDFPDLAGAVLLIEDVAEPPYKVDRMLTQLRRAGALAEVAAVAVGQFVGADADPATTTEVLTDALGQLGVPVLGGLPIGHGDGQLTVPVGVPATLDAEAGTLTASAAVC